MCVQSVLCWCWMLCPELLMQPTQVQKWSSSFSSSSCMDFKASCHTLCSISPEDMCITYHASTASVVYTNQPLVYGLVTCHLLNADNFAGASMGCALLWTQFVCCCCYAEEHPGFGALFFFLHLLFRELLISPGFVDSEMSQASKTLIGLSLLSYQLLLSELENRGCLIIHSKWCSDHSILT